MLAPDAANKNGTYDLEFLHLSAERNWRIGVATSKKPEGPFTDIGSYIEGTDHIDPTCFMDDDGQAYTSSFFPAATRDLFRRAYSE